MASSTSDSVEPKVNLTVQAQNPATEVFVVDGRFNVVARGVHRLDIGLQPGIYRVNARLGGREWKQHIALQHDQTVNVPLIEFGSASPLWDTSRTHEFHVELAQDVSRATGVTVGSGAEIFIMSRTWSSERPPPSAASSPELDNMVANVRLRRWRGDVIAELSDSASATRTTAPWDLAVAGKIEVNPGAYIVEAETPAGPIMQILFARRGWQTQAFVLHDRSNPQAGSSLDFSLLMNRGPFDATDKMQRLAEAARIALADERSVASEELIQFARSKFENPMLGLISAHLLLIAKHKQQKFERRKLRQTRRGESTRQPEAVSPIRFRQSLFDEIVSNTRRLLGADQPDIQALMTETSEGADPNHRIKIPPLFWRSWRMLIEASNDNPELIPVPLWRRVESVSTLRPYFSWTKHARPAMNTFTEAMRGLQEGLANQAGAGLEGLESVSPPPSGEKPTPDQLRDWASVKPSLRGPESAPVRPEQLDPLKREMTRRLNLPRGVLDRTLKF